MGDKRKKRRVPLRPRAHVTTIHPDHQAGLDKRLDEEYAQRKIEYARKYGQKALEEELRRRGKIE